MHEISNHHLGKPMTEGPQIINIHICHQAPGNPKETLVKPSKQKQQAEVKYI